MYDRLILELMNQTAREGVTDEVSAKLLALADSLLHVDDYNTLNVVNLQTLLLLLQDFEIKPTVKRLTEELRCRLIRQSLERTGSTG